MTGSLQPTLATAKVPWRRSPGPTTMASGRRVSGARSRAACSTRSAAWARSTPPIRRCGASRTSTTQVDRLRRQLAPFARQVRRRRARHVSEGERLVPQAAPGLAAMVAAGLPLRCVALEATGQYDTHDSQNSRARPGADDDRCVAARLPARPRGPRRRRPRADARLVGVRAARKGERLGRHRPRCGRHRLPDRLARRRHAGGRVPGARDRPRRRRQPEGDLRLPRGLRGSARAVARLRRGARDPGRRASSPGRSSSSEAPLRSLLAAGTFALGGSSPARVQVVAHEFSFTLSRTTLKPGTAVIELANFGQDAHDLRVQRRRRAAHRRHASGRGGRADGADGEAARRAILVLVLRRRSSGARDARNARRPALSVDDVGDPKGTPVVYLHGGGDSRLSRHPDDTIAASLGVRLLAVDRCGTPSRWGSLRAWAEQLLERLEVDRFGAIGWSAGGPRALALAAVAPERAHARRARRSMPPHDGVSLLPRDVQRVDAASRVSRRGVAAHGLERWGRRAAAADRRSADRRCVRARSHRVVPRRRPLARPRAAYLSRPWGFELSRGRARP